MKLIYLAHKYGGEPENVCKAVDLGTMLKMEHEHLHIFNAATRLGIKVRYLDTSR